MPSNLAHNKTEEKKWEEAKQKAKDAGQDGNYAYINAIYQNMVGKMEKKFVVTKSQLLRIVKKADEQPEQVDISYDPKVIVPSFLMVLSQARVFHWQTIGFAEHTALGGFYDGLSGLIDSFIEKYFGRNGRQPAKSELPPLVDYTPENLLTYIDAVESFLEAVQGIVKAESQMSNIVDEMKSELDQLRYLLTLK